MKICITLVKYGVFIRRCASLGARGSSHTPVKDILCLWRPHSHILKECCLRIVSRFNFSVWFEMCHPSSAVCSHIYRIVATPHDLGTNMTLTMLSENFVSPVHFLTHLPLQSTETVRIHPTTRTTPWPSKQLLWP